MTEPKKILIIGGGTMASSLTVLCTLSKCPVIVYYPGSSDKIWKKIQENVEFNIKQKLIPKTESSEILENITVSSDLEKICGGVSFVIEAIVEDLPKKKELFFRLGELTEPSVVLASNTSSLDINRLTERTRYPERVVGMHFFNPPSVLKLVEIFKSRQTSAPTLSRTLDLIQRLGKKAVIFESFPGGVVNRLFFLMLNEAMRLLAEQKLDPKTIDLTMRLGMGWSVGPLRVADLIGLDICLAIFKNLHQLYGERYQPHPTLQSLVDQGALGKKSSRGFYSYAPKSDE